MSKELTPEEMKLPKIKKITDDVFCFEDNEEMVFMPISKYEENKKYKKALEIIKGFCKMEDFQVFISLNGRLYKSLHKEDIELLKEILK